MTFVSGAEMSDSFSSVFFAFISCMVPMMVLTNTTMRKVRLLYEPFASRIAARIKNIILKYVNTFERIICSTVFEVLSTAAFTYPFSVRSATSAAERPTFGSGE